MTQVMKQTLLEGIPALDLQISDETADRLCAFGAAVVEQNTVMNLTAITTCVVALCAALSFMPFSRKLLL